MNIEQTAQQFELAAKILRTGHPWEWQASDGEWVKPTIRTELHHVISDGLAIRLALAAPPDGRQLHNPDNLTAEQVGVGYRLAVEGDKLDTSCHYWSDDKSWKFCHACSHLGSHETYRLPLSVPWPEAKPDPYAALKKAHAEGKVIQFRFRDSEAFRDIAPDEECGGPSWKYPVENYRIKPEPTFQLPPPPPGMQWHRTDGWKDGDLPQGMRPLVLGEARIDEDQLWDGKWFDVQTGDLSNNTRAIHCKSRTRRPLTFTHAGKAWTYHRPGDPMPCDEWLKVEILYEFGDDDNHPEYNTDFRRRADGVNWKIGTPVIGWRYADERKTVPLGPEDVHPCSVFCIKGKGSSGWHQMKMCPQWDGLVFTSKISVTYEELMRDWLINRSIPLTGKWNPDAWEHCHKEVDA